MLDGKETRLAGQGWNMDVSLSDAMTKSMHQKSEQRASGAGWTRRLAELDFVPDLGQNIGSVRWFRGLGTLTALSVASLALLPDYGPIYAVQPSMHTEAEFEEARAQMLMPIG